MELRQLGTTEIKITPIIFGAWAIGGWMWGGYDEKESLEAIHASLESGITTIDTAPIYGMGLSEELVGKAIKGKPRDKIVIATKCGLRWDTTEGANPWPQKDNKGNPITIRNNCRPKSIIYECEQSLKRLGVDYIDLYQIHWPDPGSACEDSWKAMVKLRTQGKVRAIGVSNYEVPMMEKCQSLHSIASNQVKYSLITRKIENELIPYCIENHIGVLAYSPLERGLLTGKVSIEHTFAQTDHRSKHPFFNPEFRQKVLMCLEKLKPLTEKYKTSFTQLAINWTLNQPGITAAIVGARNAFQAHHNAQSLHFTLTNDEKFYIRTCFDALAEEIPEKNSH